MCTISSLLCTYLQIFVVNLCCGLLSWTICATSRPTSRTTRCILYNKSITNGVGALSDETRDQLHSQRSGGIGRPYDASVHTLRDAILRALRRRTFRAAEHTVRRFTEHLKIILRKQFSHSIQCTSTQHLRYILR